MLHVDLDTERCAVERPPDSFYRTYLGGSAIGLHHLLSAMPPRSDPLGGHNVLTFAVGVVTGLAFSGQARCAATAKSPLTGAVGDSQCGGFFPAQLKLAGFDAIVLRGRASRPVYLWIKDGTAELRDAAQLWGRDTAATEDAIREELGDARIECLEIGPAGERRNALAAVMHRASRAFGRTGMGAVMGSKNLKAIAVRGTHRPSAFDEPSLRRLARLGAEALASNAAMTDLAVNGTASAVASQHFAGGLPTFNWRSGVFDAFESISGETMTRSVLKMRDTCFACVTRCKRVVEVSSGPYKVSARFGGPEYETIAALGSYCGVGDLAAIARGNELCNRYGMDTIGTGATIAWAMECFEHGLITRADTGGSEYRFGDADCMLTLIEQMAHRDGFGAVLADGSVAAARRVGRGTEALTVAVKGAELPAHMPEVKRSLALVYAVNPFGADHQSHEHDPSYTEEASALEKERLKLLGLATPRPCSELDAEKVRYAWITQKVYALTDILCLCQFDWGPAWQLFGPEQFAAMVNAATGWGVTLDELLVAAERRITMMRVFNEREGFGRSDDTLPARLFEARIGGATDGISVTRDELERAKDIYYDMAGCDRATGDPLPETLKRLGLEWVR